MRIGEFERLSQQQQVALLYKEGTYIGKGYKQGLQTVLYQVEGFYVEVFYFKYRSRIDRIYCFESTDLLGPYLQQIDIESLVHP